MGMEQQKRIFGNELEYVEEVLNTEFRSSRGSAMMQRLERAFADKFNTKYAISFINGTATMHAVLEAIGIRPGDEVIVPPLTMSSTAFVVLQAGATPVFADVNEATFLIDAKAIEKCVTKNTKAIITVSLYGLSPDMDAIMNISHKYNLFVLEDNAQCVLGKYKNRLVGTLGHAASYSFQSSKHLTSGEGGMVITNDLTLAENVRRICSLGYAGVGANKGKITKEDIQNPNYSRHIMLGWNYRLSELCSAVLLAQLENIDYLVNTRITAAKLYLEALNGCEWLKPQFVGDEYEATYWAFTLKLANPKITWHDFRNKFKELGGDGIYAAWKLTYLEPMFETMSFLGREKYISNQNYAKGICPIAESLQPQLLQFKTNYWKQNDAVKQAACLKNTIKYFDSIE
jgi:perosamine synthetase